MTRLKPLGQGPLLPERWQPTLELRFVKRQVYAREGTELVMKLILQQRFVSATGGLEWRDVPLEEEPDERRAPSNMSEPE